MRRIAAWHPALAMGIAAAAGAAVTLAVLAAGVALLG